MATATLRQRGSQAIPEPYPDLGAGTAGLAKEPHPIGHVRHGPWKQFIRMLLFATWFNGTAVVIHATQLIGSPLYFYNKDYYYAWMAYTKQCFGLVIATVTHWFSPTTVRVSWDAELKGQFKKTKDGRLESHLPERILLMPNHQIYTDWLYLWWFAYTSRMHGHIYIILRDNLRFIPMVGPGMMFFGFIFMARKWASDKPRLQHRLSKLRSKHTGPLTGRDKDLDPMWLMIFPEGTNLSANTRKRSVKWAQAQRIPDLQHVLLPRSTGLLFCLKELRGTVKYVYDCTMAYEGTPKEGYAQDYFTMRSTFFQGRPPKSVNMYWRRFAVIDMPLDDDKAFDAWVNARWREKDGFLKQFYDTGRLPAGTEGVDSAMSDDGYIDTDVRLGNWWEIGQIFVVLAAAALIANVITKIYTMFLSRQHT